MWRTRIICSVGAGVGTVLTCLAVASAGQAAGWSVQSVPGRGQLSGVSCPSPGECIAVGHSPAFGSSTWAFVERWAGGAWSTQHTPTPVGARGSSLLAVSCVSRKWCVAVGTWYKHRDSEGGVTLAERWNGSRWALQPTPAPAGLHDGLLDGVSCTSASSCTATAVYTDRSRNTESRVERWNGTRWSIQRIQSPVGAHGATGSAFLTGVSCVSGPACIAVGIGFVPPPVPSVTLAERWNGSRWSIQHTPSPSPTLGANFSGVSCTGMRACWAVGGNTVPSNSPSSPPSQATLAERWNGRRWTIVHTPNPSLPGGASLDAVSCRSSSACTAVGAGPSGLAPIAESWNGQRWSIQDTPTLPGASNGFFGVSCNWPTLCIAVGVHGGQPLVERHT
jgi:hypothetical protein